MYDDEEDQQNSDRSDNPDEIGSDPSMLVLSPQKMHTGWRAVQVPWQDQSLSLDFFGVPLPPTPTTAIRVERFSFIYLGWSIRFRLLSHLALILSQPINFLSLRNVSCLDLGRIDMPFDFGILRNVPCLTHLIFVPLSRLEPMSHIIPRKPYFPSHKHAMKPYFPPLTHVTFYDDIKVCYLTFDEIYKFLCDPEDESENIRGPNDLMCLSPTTETLEGRIEPTWPEYQSANSAMEQHTGILPHKVPHVMTRNNAVTATTLQMETDKSMTTPWRSSASESQVFSATLLSPQCLSGSIALDNLAQSCPVPTGSAEEERYGKIINPSMEHGPALQPDAFPNVGKIMEVDSSEQESSVRFDAANIGGNVVSANKNCTTTCSQKKITITELLPLVGLTREAAAEKIGVSIPTFKRKCRLYSIVRWPHYRNKKECRSLQQKLAADPDQGAAGAFGHFVTGSHTGAIASNHHNSPCSKPAKRQREKKTSPSCKTPSTVATCSDPAPAPMQAMSTFPQIMPHLRAGQDARIEISKTTEDILIQSVEGVTTRPCLSPQKRAGSDVPSIPSPKHFHCTEIMDQMLESSHPASKGQLQEQSTFHLQKQNAGTANIKAKYGDKIVKVPPPATSGIVKLKEELARRLGLKHGSFYVEYEDEEHDWILIACDALQECLTSSTSRDNQVIRLSVRDEVVNSQNSGKALEC
ncbi:unnamed protein product [Camellia sinensis]